ncbi:hypothetical protein ABZ865_29630 [Streptomyces sp. NPDC047085]|uniref:hypothetical protein n=1 Tax=Streptomyces sp. NPDC047085 TaxID=3155140 RepID=UPI0034042CB4
MTPPRDAAGAAYAYAELLNSQRQILGPDHTDTLTTLRNMTYWWRKAWGAAADAGQ